MDATVSPPWTDWLTESFFRIRVASAAADKLRQLRAETQERLRLMLQDIADLADLVPPGSDEYWLAGDGTALLQLHLGKISVRYSMNEESRTLTIEHVIVPQEELGETG